jgi:uncharacterized protein (DUF924 family)
VPAVKGAARFKSRNEHASATKRLFMTGALQPIFEFSMDQIAANIEVISRFGRFPHRNDVLGRASTDEERAYIDRGDFVHRRHVPGAVR